MNKEQTNKKYSLKEAVEILPSLSKSKFIGSVDIDILLNLKDKQKKESIRGSVDMPNKFGEDKSIIVFCNEKDVAGAKAAGAKEAGLEDLKEKVIKNEIKFDIVMATPDVMAKIIELGKVLGPKGLMPNPKNGTVTSNISEAIKSFSAGKMNYKMIQDQGTIKTRVAKLDMKPEEIQANLIAFLKSVFNETKKFGANPFKKVLLKPTIGSGLSLDVNDIISSIK